MNRATKFSYLARGSTRSTRRPRFIKFPAKYKESRAIDSKSLVLQSGNLALAEGRSRHRRTTAQSGRAHTQSLFPANIGEIYARLPLSRNRSLDIASRLLPPRPAETRKIPDRCSRYASQNTTRYIAELNDDTDVRNRRSRRVSRV